MKIELLTGSARYASGSQAQPRGGNDGDVIVSELHGRYAEQMMRGNSFSAANQAAQAVSVALATTYTGLLLYNPVGSGKLLIPNKVKYALSVAPAAISVLGLLTGFSATGGVTAQTTKLTVQANQVGNAAAGVGIALSAATIVTPTVLATLYDGFTAAALPNPALLSDLEGVFGIQPGGFIGIYALTAVTGLGWISWEEVNLPQ
jgi:hypothetical protein